MRARALHAWDVTPAEARQIQASLAHQVSRSDAVTLDAIRCVAGVDDAYVREGESTIAYAAVVVLTFPELEVVERAIAATAVAFPYVPGLLSFREIPAVLAAWDRIQTEPDAILCDGQGYAHPRRFGLASHLGLVLDRPTIGCAKRRLVGRYEEPGPEFGSATPLVDRGEVVGAAVRTRPGRVPLFVSPGHNVSVETAVAIALACCRNNQFMPVPTKAAHDAVTAATRAHRVARGRGVQSEAE